MGFRMGHVPANRGATCLRRKYVYSPWLNKKVLRCAKFGPASGYAPVQPAPVVQVTTVPSSGDVYTPLMVLPPSFQAVRKRVSARARPFEPQIIAARNLKPITRAKYRVYGPVPKRVSARYRG